MKYLQVPPRSSQLMPTQKPPQPILHQTSNIQANLPRPPSRYQHEVIISVPMGPPMFHQSQPHFYLQFPQQMAHPMPQQVLEHIPYRRASSVQQFNINNKTK